MKKLVTVLAVSLFAVACAPKATPEECKAACQKQNDLTMATAESPVAKIEAMFQQKMNELQNAQAQAMQGIDKEHQEKLAKAKKEPEKAKINEEYNKKRAEKAAEFAPQFQAMAQQKAEMVKKAQEERAKAIESAVAACTQACEQGGFTKTRTDCQAAAASLEDWGKCQ